jgi:RNA polymerase sigma-70 factor, ECF subfamily
MSDIVSALYIQESRRVFSTLVRLLGSFDLAEDALHDAFIAATEQWPSCVFQRSWTLISV